MAVVELVGGALLSAFFKVLFDRLASRDFLDLFKGNKPIENLLQRFKTKLESANVLLKDAEEKQLTDEDVRDWLHNLKEVIFRADELTDKIDYEVLRRELEGVSSMTISSFFDKFDKSVEDEIEDILACLDLLLNENVVPGMEALSLTSHGAALFPGESKVYGREADKEAIMKLVQSDNKPMVVPIVGMAGIGKTTLAQWVFHDVSLDFQKKVWVTVSTKSDVFNITKEIFKQVTTRDFSNEELSLLQGDLKKALERKKFLVVLDDVWNENGRFLDDLRRPFTSGASGSKIIITTQSTKVARIVNNNREEHINLGRLTDSICWEFFIQRAFQIEDLNAHQDLSEIGKELVRKCEGLPVAVKSVAALLGSTSLEDWRTILENKIWESNLREDILPALWLSYSYLSPQLKRCFAYCSIFPKGHEFRKGEVILLWMAEGLLQSKGKATMEALGDHYFTTLTSRSFFQPKSESSFIMHGCMHDLATFVLGDFSFRLEENDLDKLPKRVRHLSIMNRYIRDLKQFEGAKFLRTFLTLNFNGSSPDQHKVPLPELLKKKKFLRVVSLPRYRSITKLPDSVGKLKHLRYLDLSNTAIKEIPNTICSLYNLETFLLKNCGKLTGLPSDFGRLVKLRHFDFDGSPIKKFPRRICNLTNLQTLNKFIVCKKKGRCRINELGDLQHLRGKFDISGLENVVDVENVSKAKLGKKFLTRLGLFWNEDSGDPVKHRKVLDRLRPYEKLEELHISGYNGESFSYWMGHQSFGSIRRVELVKCGKCNSLSPIEQLPSLKELWISQWQVEKLGWEFNSNGSSTQAFEHLEDLSFENMPNWKEGLFTGGARFPRLKQLRFYGCPKLDVQLPDCFPALTGLVVNCCRQLRPLIGENTGQGRGGGFSYLEELEIFECPEQKAFSNDELGLPSSVNISIQPPPNPRY